VRHLSKFFVKPAIQSITTPADSAGGLARWRVLCHHRDTGKAIGLVEVAGPAEALAKAALVAACRRISIAVMFDALGGVSFEPAPAVPVPPP
jgi:hypothetical protein